MLGYLKNMFKLYISSSLILFIRKIRYKLARVHVDKKSEIYDILSQSWHDYKKDLHPKDRRMDILEQKNVKGMSTDNISFFINEIVHHLCKNGVYLEVGTFQGRSLLSAALFNPSTRCIAIDNFSQFDKERKNEAILSDNLKKFMYPKNIEFYNQDYKQAIRDIFFKEPNLKIDVYYYDGVHTFEDQFEGLSIVLPYLQEKCTILVDDINWEFVSNANKVFIKKNPEFRSVFKIYTKANGSNDWWNGFEVITRAP
ncbi:MAG: class I SAM-dependent methyltransferase [Candidatus Omnitrophota bacterium]|jgi:tRNA G46 methylase TrmB